MFWQPHILCLCSNVFIKMEIFFLSTSWSTEISVPVPNVGDISDDGCYKPHPYPHSKVGWVLSIINSDTWRWRMRGWKLWWILKSSWKTLANFFEDWRLWNDNWKTLERLFKDSGYTINYSKTLETLNKDSAKTE